MARTLEETLAAVTNASTRTDSIIADRAQLKAQVVDLLSHQGDIPAGVQAGLDQIFDVSTSDAAKIDTALNTGVEPPPVVEPPVGRRR